MTSFWRRRAQRAGLMTLVLAGCYSRVPDRETREVYWLPFVSGEGGQTDIWAVALPGGQYRRLTDDVHAEASPVTLADGRIVYSSFETGRWRLMILDPRAGAGLSALPQPLYPRPEGDDFAPAASPTGQIVFVSNRSGQKQLFAVTPGEAPRLLTPQPGDHDNPAVGADGSIYFVSSSPFKRDPGTRQIWRMAGDGSAAVQLSNLTLAMTELAILPADKLPPPARLDHALLMPSPAPGQPFAQVLKPSVLYVAHRPGRGPSPLQAGGPDLDIYRLDTGTGRQLNLTQRSGDDVAPVVLPTGLIAFTTNRRNRQEIWTMDGWGSEQRPWIEGTTWARTR